MGPGSGLSEGGEGRVLGWPAWRDMLWVPVSCGCLKPGLGDACPRRQQVDSSCRMHLTSNAYHLTGLCTSSAAAAQPSGFGHTDTEVHEGGHWLCSRPEAVRCLAALSSPSRAHVNHTIHSTHMHTSRVGSSAGTMMVWGCWQQVAPGDFGSKLTHPVHNKVEHLCKGAAAHGVRDVKLLHLHRLLCRPAHAQAHAARARAGTLQRCTQSVFTKLPNLVHSPLWATQEMLRMRAFELWLYNVFTLDTLSMLHVAA